MTFFSETRAFRTSACLQVTERTYPASAWWENVPATAAPEDRAFASVVAAIKQKDRAALIRLTEPSQARDTAKFDTQANAFFQQFQTIQLLETRRAYEFDGLVAFFGKFQSSSQTAFVPLTFAHEGDSAFGFLPSRTRQATFTMVSDWYAPSNVPLSETPAYCSDAAVRRATHRIVLGSSTWRPSGLLLAGAPYDAANSPVAPVASLVKTTIDQIRDLLRKGNVDEVATHMTPEGGGRLKQWYAAVTPKEREDYASAFVSQQPFFIFDASPLAIVYTRTSTKEIQVLYFLITDDKQALWANSSHITVADQVFKQGPLFAAAATTTPFSGIVIKQ